MLIEQLASHGLAKVQEIFDEKWLLFRYQRHHQKMRDTGIPINSQFGYGTSRDSQIKRVEWLQIRGSPYLIWLVGQGQPSEKYDFVNWDD